MLGTAPATLHHVHPIPTLHTRLPPPQSRSLPHPPLRSALPVFPFTSLAAHSLLLQSHSPPIQGSLDLQSLVYLTLHSFALLNSRAGYCCTFSTTQSSLLSVSRTDLETSKLLGPGKALPPSSTRPRSCLAARSRVHKTPGLGGG